jgi:hypothetical protein
MSDKTVYVKSGASPLFLLFLVLLVLKLTGFVAWSWWWVTAPLWAPIAAIVAVGSLIAIIAGVICLGAFVWGGIITLLSKKK